MLPQVSVLNLGALSGICGSISIACWVVVFSPQIIENFRRGSAEGLSLTFLIIWLVGDVFNILGSVLQGVLPTMIILAVYYTLADIILLGQCLYYRWSTLREVSTPPQDAENGAEATERSALLRPKPNGNQSENYFNAQSRAGQQGPTSASALQQQDHPQSCLRRYSAASVREILHPSVDGTHLSPATPFIEPNPKATQQTERTSTTKAAFFNVSAILLVIVAGVLGWYIGQLSSNNNEDDSNNDNVNFHSAGQVFGYLCAFLYLGSRVPQMLLNYKRKSTEGVSLLFFIFACLGNLTYVLSILAYSPTCEGKHGECRPGEAAGLYWRYVLVNLSWLLGSFGTLLLDMAIFVQFFLYKHNSGTEINVQERD